MIKPVGKHGDTLVEVMLAVGIFSMVAVAVVSVMSGGTNSSQTALETTLTREEIDNQAEALRFIHKAYIADVKNGTNSKFGELWKNITDNAANASVTGSSSANQNVSDDITQFDPSTCDELYAGGAKSISGQNGFVINPQAITDYVHDVGGVGIGNVVLRTSSGKLQRASTYPHLIFGNQADVDTALIDRDATATSGNNSLYNSLYRAEGIYVVAVKDQGSTAIAGNLHTSKPAYYDFYIRTCWYGTGDQSPSTISTVIRLYNPDVTSS